MNDRLLSMLGLCRKAGKLGWGHDACLGDIKHGRARACLLMSDASDRLKREFGRAASSGGGTVPVLQTAYTMDMIKGATGYRAGVLTVNDEGFAKKIAELHRNEEPREDFYDK
ncbi:MAG: 50S ribosomal protein L7ae [Oscillospiraceae bacterium]|nr:50S ribosomal protein L7ae [Oscillospiraceae bacterium]